MKNDKTESVIDALNSLSDTVAELLPNYEQDRKRDRTREVKEFVGKLRPAIEWNELFWFLRMNKASKFVFRYSSQKAKYKVTIQVEQCEQ